MLRHQGKGEQLLKHLFATTQQQRFIQQHKSVLYNKNTNISRQGKIMEKFFGHRTSGSKKRWFPSATETPADTQTFLKQSNFGKASSGGGKNATRRMTILNKLFMKHITDLLATGEISESILGKGLQITRVKISQDFAHVNVYWLASCTPEANSMLENELQCCSGLLRHELSQLCLMGVVPRIKFVKDKLYNNMNQVENLLRNMDFGSQDEEDQMDIKLNKADFLKQNFYAMKPQDLANDENSLSNNKQLLHTDFEIPEMRHDVLGLDHKGIMLKIHTKMKKSKQAWDQHLQNPTLQSESENHMENHSTIPSVSYNELTKMNEKLNKIAANSEKFEAFLAKRKEKRNTPERKKFRASDHQIDNLKSAKDEPIYMNQVMSTQRRQLFEAEDYLSDDMEESKT